VDDDEKKSVLVQIMLPPSQLQAIDDWRFRKRISSRAEAMRQLMAFAVDELTKRERSNRKGK
jgi:metal-responsive CopG/Arc/MetJ family transcriptional regulator